jgi:hypothetical protein
VTLWPAWARPMETTAGPVRRMSPLLKTVRILTWASCWTGSWPSPPRVGASSQACCGGLFHTL